MEAKLREYRELRKRKELLEAQENLIEEPVQEVTPEKQNLWDKFLNFLVPKTITDMGKDKKDEEVLLLEEYEEEPEEIYPKTNLIMEESVEIASETSEESKQSWRYCIIKWSFFAIVWLSLYIVFLNLKFGAVYFVVSILICICLNTRTRPKKEGEVSAYSVFNPHCVSIDGTLNVEQIERELRFGPGSVR